MLGEVVKRAGVKEARGVLLPPPPLPPPPAVLLALPLAVTRCCDTDMLSVAVAHSLALANPLALTLPAKAAEAVPPTTGSEAVGFSVGVETGVAEGLGVGSAAEGVLLAHWLSDSVPEADPEAEAVALPALLAVAAQLSEASSPVALPALLVDTEALAQGELLALC